MAVQWRIYYSADDAVDNTQAAPSEVRPWGVQVIVQRDETIGKLLVSRADFYIYRKDMGCWVPADWLGMLDQVCYLLPQVGAVLKGLSVSREAFEAAHQKAWTDPDFPTRSPAATVFDPPGLELKSGA